ncbi:arginine repressor [Pseudolactococcus reticulitermitis]|uniref:Arginine repressor n=1 Tax=Pseudolactococcus reticulitermitis TaxID=2025039 RepID=A0A224X6M7_9LACT|nr:arginine repressor [Lactococcus reticulitermitis]GAX47130.1 arginine pathway regulatory protein ArgR [Lactococcus reticulitermitis]
MKKLERQKIIRQLIQNNKIETQEELSQRLSEKGITTTQATLSRDIRELGIIKNRYDEGSFYAVFDYEGEPENTGVIRTAMSLMATMSAYAQSVRRAMFILVVHTGLGEADLVADAIDTSNRSEILGTIAGADTLLITCQDEASAANFEREIRDAIQPN